MLKSVHHLNLIVSDMDRTNRFYHETLGLEIALESVIEDSEFSRGADLPDTKLLATFFKLPDNSAMIETFQYLVPSGRKPLPLDKKVNDMGWTRLCFQVDDIDRVYEDLKAKGVKYLTDPANIAKDHPHFPGVRLCYFLGPDRVTEPAAPWEQEDLKVQFDGLLGAAPPPDAAGNEDGLDTAHPIAREGELAIDEPMAASPGTHPPGTTKGPVPLTQAGSLVFTPGFGSGY